jgi:nicotinate-nucleotide adenylyltransferase
MRRIGIYPGSFDPLHAGHLAFAEAALQVAELDEVIFLPEMKPRGKPQVSPLAVRQHALEIKTAQNKRLGVMSLPIERFTIAETLPVLQEKFNGARLALLVGSDVVHTFQYRWPGLETLLRSMDLIVGLRSDDTVHDIEALMTSLEMELNCTITYSLITTPYAHLASSQIRDDPRTEDSSSAIMSK